MHMSDMRLEALAEAIGRARGSALDELARGLWAGVAAGQISEAQAIPLGAAIDARRPLPKPPDGPKLLGAIRLTLKPPRCPERVEAVELCRRWAAAGRMPPAIAAKFTQGEQGALAVIVFDVSKRQFCDKPIGAIAALAGISVSTVKRAVRQARALGLLTVEERRLSRYRNDTNIVRIVSKAWLSWIEMRSRRSTAKERKAEAKGARQENGAGSRGAGDRGAMGGGQRRTGLNTNSLKQGKQEAEQGRKPASRALPNVSGQAGGMTCRACGQNREQT